MSKLVTIYGGSGFVGRYIARRFARAGWRVRVAVRRPNEALFVRPYGAPGQVEAVLCNVRDAASVARAALGADALVNCVGTFDTRGKNNLTAINVTAAQTIARAAADLGVGHLVHLSALGAALDSPSNYGASKAEGEAAVVAAYPAAVILRPSVIFGTEDRFFNRFAGMNLPLMPITGGKTRFQPVWVDDVAEAAVNAVLGAAPAGVYELGGPDAASLKELIARMLPIVQRRRVVVNVPRAAFKPLAVGLDVAEIVTAGLIKNKVISLDQLRMLGADNVVSEGARGLKDLGVTPSAFEAVTPDYLWCYRPSGQYAAIKASAGKLKKV